MNTSMIVYRLFDVADEINLDLVQALWTSRNKIASRLRLDRISTKSITFKDPPVSCEPSSTKTGGSLKVMDLDKIHYL